MKKKKVEWKDTKIYKFYPEYNYSLSVRNRFVFFWSLAKNFRKTINFASNFITPNKICIVYIFGEFEIEKLKKYIKDKSIIIAHLAINHNVIDIELKFHNWLDTLERQGQRQDDGPNDEWFKWRENNIKAKESGAADDDLIAELNEQYNLWQVEHPKAFELIKNKLSEGYNCYGIYNGKIDGSIENHSPALENITKEIYKFGIEFDNPKEYAYKLAASKKLMVDALNNKGAETLGIELPATKKQLSFFDTNTIGANEAINTLKSWCDNEIKNKGFFCIDSAWSLYEKSPFGAYKCNWHSWIFAYVMKDYCKGIYFIGNDMGNTYKIKNSNGFEAVLEYVINDYDKRYKPMFIFKQNEKQLMFIHMLAKLFDITLHSDFTILNVITKARIWAENNIHHAPLALIDEKLGEILHSNSNIYWFGYGYENKYLPWITENFDRLYKDIRDADNILYNQIASEYGKMRADLYYKYYYIKGGALSWLWDTEMVKERVDKYMKIENVCRECGQPLVQFNNSYTNYDYEDGKHNEYNFSEKDIIGLNKKLLGRYQNEYFCIPCLCEVINTSVGRLHEMVHDFKEQGCELF